MPPVAPIGVIIPRSPRPALSRLFPCRNLPRLYPSDDVEQFGKRIDGEVCPYDILTKEAVIAVDAESAGCPGHLDVRTVIANDQNFVGRGLKTLHEEVERARVGLQLRERVSSGDVLEPFVESVLPQKRVD